MQKIKDFLYRFRCELFAVFGASIVLWQMLLPGYVIVLDMVFGPHVALPSYSGLSAAGFPVSYLIYLLHFILIGSVLQKFILFVLFFLLFYLPFRFYPFVSNYGEVYFISIFYTINPFVYERFLAGQWKVLMAYAFLFPFLSLLLRFFRELSWRLAFYAFGWLLLIGMFSLHVLVMGLIILSIYIVLAILWMVLVRDWQVLKIFLQRFLGSAAVFFLMSGYWLIPLLNTQTTVLSVFARADFEAFKTAGDIHIGTLSNVAALYGFWGEHETWNTYWNFPKEKPWLWGISGLVLALIIILGVARGLRDSQIQFFLLLLLFLAVVACIFSAGLGSSVFLPFNNWLFEHVWFWRGFRDTEKWSAVLTLSYVFLGGLGVSYIFSKFKWSRVNFFALCCVPILYTPNMLLGFNNQIHSVQYPDTWQKVNNILKHDPTCKAIFLPWHEYYTAVFNNRTLAGNTASVYFNCDIISAANAEIGGVSYGIKAIDPVYQAIDGVIISNTSSPDTTIELLSSYGVRYIIFTSDESYDDIYKYPFLTSSRLQKIFETPTLLLFKLIL